MIDLSKIAPVLKKLFSGDKKVKLIVAIGLAGMLLILLSYFMDSGGKKMDEAPESTVGTAYLSDDYARQLEDRLEGLIASVEGVGRVQVMVTLEHGTEFIYAQEEKSSTDRTTQDNGEVDYRHDVEYNYVFVDVGYGEKQPLVLTQTPPKVQGVIIVCEGAGDVRVQDRVTNVVTTALHIPTTRVCVVKINAE